MTSAKNDIHLNSSVNNKSAEEVTIEKISTSFAGLISQEQINLLLAKTPLQTRSQLLVHCNNIFPKYEINTPERIAMWFAQCGHESGDFIRFVENLNYSAQGLLKTFPKYFTKEEANAFARKPEMIANKIYDDVNRGKNHKLGNTQKGDGWKFRGRGFIQITGRKNYTDFARFIGKPEIVETPDILATNFEIMVLCACWFFKTRNINNFADKRNIQGATRLINGGTNGFEDRQERFARCLKILT